MNANKLKPFAQAARRILMEGVTRRVLYSGFDAKGKVVEEPMHVAGGVILRGEVIDDPTLTGSIRRRSASFWEVKACSMKKC